MPEVTSIGVVVHVGGAGKQGAVVVGPDEIGDRGAIVVAVCIVPNVEDATLGVVLQQRTSLHPIPDFGGPVCIALVPGDVRQPRRELEIAAIGDGVFQIVTCVETKHLPSEPASTGVGIPERGLEVEHGLRQRQPGRIVATRLGKLGFNRIQGGKGPKALVVYSHAPRLVRRVVVVVGASLELKGLSYDGIVGGIAGVLPVVDQ